MTEPQQTETEEPDVVFHYTTTAAFMSIIDDMKLRLSALALSNDKEEGEVGFKIASSYLRRAGFKRELVDEVIMVARRYRDTRVGLGACFSDRNLLSQWRLYGEDCRGVAIGFSREQLDVALVKRGFDQRSTTRMVKVTYVNPHHPEGVKLLGHSDLLDQSLKGLVELHDGGLLPPDLTAVTAPLDGVAHPHRKNENTKRLLKAIFGISFSAYYLKSDAFRDEREWRLIDGDALQSATSRRRGVRIGLDEDFEYATKPGRVIPYASFTIDPKMIVEVHLGPQHETAPALIDAILESKGIKAAVSQYAAPYRS